MSGVDPQAIRDLFGALGPVRTRRMFGGQGIYAGELMFALEIDGELYLKVDDGILPAFEAAGSRPFTYEKRGRTAQTSYWRLPGQAGDGNEGGARRGRLGPGGARGGGRGQGRAGRGAGRRGGPGRGRGRGGRGAGS